ncbi:PREDICTED: leukocyte immunoglobulin-like receptor subfamily B member 3 [Lipotes vexillifer]|uniref:Leukocyte immunoglobulin-like receptor subfamily B member 3 n=1 Tax=Lipotes vexillifer TaxID=118797 RepID=A0A340XUT4_LIPVE|nr:PREDICTED: leukocyte immunoglobulin-like receptor subfamily B member 3 [Lipotes vexillifer]
MTPSLTALLCLGLSVGLRTQVQAGTLPKPTIWAEPGSVIPWGSPVTIRCQGTLRAREFHLDKEGSSPPWERQPQLEPGDKGKFSISHMTQSYAGRYHCYYRSPTGWSEHSDPLELVVTGAHGKPTLSALPSPVVTSGGTVTLQCGSWEGLDRFILTKEGEPKSSWTLDAQRGPQGQTQALLPVGRVPPSHRWIEQSSPSARPETRASGATASTFTGSPDPSLPGRDAMTPSLTALLCLGLSVGLRTQVQAGTLPKPTIWAEPGSVIPWGSPVTIRCQGTLRAREFHLDKEGSSPPWERQPQLEPGDKGKFSISHMTQSYAGRYHCYYRSPTGWSEHSDPLELVVTGWFPDTPSLSVQPGPVVASGENVTLLCQSGSTRETFLLSKEGAARPPLRLRSKYRGGHYQAEFSMSPVTSAHSGTYRCYSSLSSNPYLLSHASAPLELTVSGPSGGPSPPPTGPSSTPGLKWYLNVLIGVSVAFVLLPLVLLVLQRVQSRRRKSAQGEADFHPPAGAADPEPKDTGLQSSSCPAAAAQDQALSDAAVKDPQPEDGVQLDHPQNRQDVDPQEGTYAQVNHSRSRLRRGVATSPSSLSGRLLDMKDRQAEEDGQRDSQAAASEAPQDVTYAQLNHSTFRRETAPPAPQSGEPPEEPSVYAALAVR